jgi:hypothetical protein
MRSARAALLDWLHHLEAQRTDTDGSQFDQNPLMSEHGVAVDKALVLAQLALLEERHGDPKRAREYWQRAVDQAKMANWKDYSESAVRKPVDKPNA